MRFAGTWLVVLAACGRVGFDSVQPDLPIGEPLPPGLMTVDPSTLGMFGAPQLVTELATASEDEDDPALSRDQLEIFFDREENGDHNLFTSRRASTTDPWPPPVPITQLNTAGHDEHPSLSADGLTLYFSSRADLWAATRADRDSPWDPPVLLAALSASEHDDDMGAVSADECVFVFSSKRLRTTDDLFEAQRGSPDQPWSAPQRIEELSEATYERSVHIDDHGLVAYYDRGGIPRLRWSQRDSTSSRWQLSEEIDELVVEGEEESDPWLSPDLRTLYYVRDIGGNKDIYVATR